MLSLIQVGGGGAGGVTSFTGDSVVYNNSASTGAVTLSFISQIANKIFAGPSSGGNAAPTFRFLVGADLPVPSATTLGGIKSLASVASNWINAISTSGVPSATQPAFTDISGTATPAQGAVAQLTSAGSGYFYSCGVKFNEITTNTTPAMGTGNQLRVVKFVLPWQQTIRKISVRVIANVAASFVVAGIYSADGNTKLVDAGTNAFDSSVANTTRTVTLGSPVTLNAGEYWFAYGPTVSLVTISGSILISETTLLNANATRMGTAANAISSGALPATLGVISATTFNTSLVLFEG